MNTALCGPVSVAWLLLRNGTVVLEVAAPRVCGPVVVVVPGVLTGMQSPGLDPVHVGARETRADGSVVTPCVFSSDHSVRFVSQCAVGVLV